MKRAYWLLSSLAVLGVVSVAYCAKPESAASKPQPEQVELFAAMKAGDIQVKLIPKDSTTGTVIIANKTKKPLRIALPEAFAGVPVAAQFDPGGGMGGGMGGMGGGMGGMGGGGNQGTGGGFGGGGMGGGMGGMGGGGGGGFFNVAPEKAGKLKVVSVCLEHGKADPNPRVPYTIVPIEKFTKDQNVIEMVKMLGTGRLDQHSAQAAAWHLANDMSWEELATKIGRKHLNGSTEPYFTTTQLQRAIAIARVAQQRAEKVKVESPGEQQTRPVSLNRQ